MSENHHQDQVVTIDALRAAAESIPPKNAPSLDELGRVLRPTVYEAHEYERARAEFWRLAYLWQRESETRFRDGQLPMTEQSAFEGIIAEVEART